MEKDPKQIAENIIALVLELAKLAGEKIELGQKNHHNPKSSRSDTSGATGGLRILVGEGYFNDPKQLPEIIERLKQGGRHYSNATISMGLLNLVRERILTRFRDGGDKKWKYAIRK
ncbi:hypothetical protein A3I30_00045 [Candidatus Azambacteria bacterium RIFCSPLOWO2_02_FULL_44_14]|uniref:HTH HARE-type domain-containing protein n=1 Tax=Candidatus Azambacteria bacterium RIFCSPLOWO2_02_FULL_44_14 TaxID=1797306 RepID=A0A1F5CC62_9BACT|nr:MAG: hypothetical protein A3I30_00045 [Candidatus Azambacteria bacterium RIFCSPLOWO2_02_FULL_44_14]